MRLPASFSLIPGTYLLADRQVSSSEFHCKSTTKNTTFQKNDLFPRIFFEEKSVCPPTWLMNERKYTTDDADALVKRQLESPITGQTGFVDILFERRESKTKGKVFSNIKFVGFEAM